MSLSRTVWKLLRAQWWVFLNNLRRAKGRKLFGYIASLLVTLGLGAGAFWLSWTVLSFLQSPQAGALLGSANLDSVPILMLSGVFLATFLISFQVLLQALYLAGDMDFLLSMPIPARAVFIVKLLQAVQPNFVLLGLFTLPLLWGLGAAGGYNALYYPLTVLLFAFQLLGAAGLSALLVMAVVRIFPARRVFEVISFLGGLLGILCSQWYNLSQTLRGSETEITGAEFTQLTSALDQLSSPWIPLGWPGMSLVALAQGRWLAGLAYLVLSLGLTGGLFLLSLSLAERLYYTGWARVHAAAVRRVKPAPVRPSTATRRLGLLPPAVNGILQKDLKLLRRDLRNISQLISPIIFAIIYAVMILSRGTPAAENGPAEIIEQYSFFLAIMIALFACWGLVSRLAMMGFSQEGNQYWVLKTAPVSAGQLALAKWLAAFLPGMVVGNLLVIGLGVIQGVAFADLLFGLLAVTLIVAGSTGLHLAFGITGARLNWSDPRRMISGSAGCITSLLSLISQGLSLVLFLGPPAITQLFGAPSLVGYLIGLALGGTLSAALAFLPPRLVLSRVPRIGEESD